MRTLVFALAICGLAGAPPRFLQRSVGAEEGQLSRRIPAANPEKYGSVRDARDWLNPYIVVRADGIEVIAKAIPSGRTTVAAEDLRAMLLRLPVKAWPYGRIVAAQENGVRAADRSDDEPMKRNHQAVEAVLKGLHVEVDWWPSA
jgi:hypothetical protein